MPCHDSRNDPSNVAAETRKESRDKINLLTRVACDLARVLRSGLTAKDLSAETLAWVKRHEKWDAIREAREKQEPTE